MRVPRGFACLNRAAGRCFPSNDFVDVLSRNYSKVKYWKDGKNIIWTGEPKFPNHSVIEKGTLRDSGGNSATYVVEMFDGGGPFILFAAWRNKVMNANACAFTPAARNWRTPPLRPRAFMAEKFDLDQTRETAIVHVPAAFA
jgi:hypothetical protein